MQVLLLATNETPKLEPLGTTLASPLIPIVNRPVMEILIELLARKGYKQLLVSLYKEGGAIVSHFGIGRRWGVHIDYVMQREGWGDAGAVRWVGNAITETVLVVPADIIIDFDIETALDVHRESGSALTLIATRQNWPPKQPLTIDENDKVIDKITQDRKLQVEFTGAFFCEPRIINYVSNKLFSTIYRDILPALLNENQIVRAHIIDTYWNPLETFPQYEEAQQAFLYNSFPAARRNVGSEADIPKTFPLTIPGNQIAPGIWIGLNTTIHPSARLAPPLCIGEGCRIGHNAELGPGAIIAPSVVIDDEATVRHSTILRRSYIGRLVNINHRLVHQSTMIDLVTGYNIDVTDKFLISNIELPKWHKKRLLRIIDIFAAIFFTFLLLPLLLAVFLLTVIFINRNPFSKRLCYGLRAVEGKSKKTLQNAQIFSFQTTSRDGSVNVLGKMIRFCGMHRMPELWNVLKGDLRFVGVKPLTLEEHSFAEKTWQQKRDQYAMGFTGLWYTQFAGSSSLNDILIADAYYTATRTWFGDLKIFFQTPLAGFRSRLVRSQVAVHADAFSANHPAIER